MSQILFAEVGRRLEQLAVERLAAAPVVVIHGPRTGGKSTVLRRIAAAQGAMLVNLDEPAVRAAAAADPGLYTSLEGLVLIDEYQQVPMLLDAVKAAVDRDFRPGRFLITGSTNYATIPRASQSLTGRAEVLTLWPMSQGEISGTGESFTETLLAEPGFWQGVTSHATREEYAARVLGGGMPVALRRGSELERRRWFAAYTDLVMARDVLDLRAIRQREALPKLLRALVGQTGQLLNVAKAAERAGLSRAVGIDYVQLLEAVFLVRRLGAWGRTLNSRANASPKLHALDSGVGGWLMGLGADRLARRDPTSLEQFGHLLETFAVHEVLKQADWLAEPPAAGHYRTKDDAEVDLVLERFDGGVCGIEVKAGTVIGARDCRGLVGLRERLGSSFLGGVVLHLGDRGYRLGDRLFAVPLDRLWARS